VGDGWRLLGEHIPPVDGISSAHSNPSRCPRIYRHSGFSSSRRAPARNFDSPKLGIPAAAWPNYGAKSTFSTFTAIGRSFPGRRSKVPYLMGYSVSEKLNHTSRFPHLLVVALVWLTLAILFAWSMYW
jgi:hypothetical protein